MAWRDDYEQKYKPLREKRAVVTGELLERYKGKCQENIWIKRGGVEFEPEGFCSESDYDYSLIRYDNLEILKLFFEHGNWAIRQGVQYEDLVFVQQVNGGDEWWTLKIDGDQLIAFESMTMRGLIRDGRFEDVITRMVRATPQQCRALEY